MLRPFKIAVGHPDVRYIASPCSIAVVGCGLLWLDTWCLAPWCYTGLVRFKQFIAKAVGGRQMITSPSHPFFKMPDDNGPFWHLVQDWMLGLSLEKGSVLFASQYFGCVSNLEKNCVHIGIRKLYIHYSIVLWESAGGLEIYFWTSLF